MGSTTGTNHTRYKTGWGTSGRERRVPKGPPAKLKMNLNEIRAHCKETNTLFEDPDFGAVDSSIYYKRRPTKSFEWKRPHELCDNPQIFVHGASRFDINQGSLGDCWFLAAVACLSQQKNLLYRVVPPDQSFHDNYCGAFHFYFWTDGKWTEVIIDDRLPSHNGKLLYMHSTESNEFWSSLLEKAYAKLFGSYETLKGGQTIEALEDFTGGVTELIDLQDLTPPNLFQVMLKGYERQSLMGCSIQADPGSIEARLDNGLIIGHAYSVTGVMMVDIDTPNGKEKVKLIRIRNPWGDDAEWTGPWSDRSKEWQSIPEETRKEIGLVFNDDGEFLMSYEDFIKNFYQLEMCNLSAESLTDDPTVALNRRWEEVRHGGSWIKKVTAGGSRNNLETFWTNPQYHFKIVDPDEDDEDTAGTVLIAIMQLGRRKMLIEGKDLLTIGYSVYALPEDKEGGPLDQNFFEDKDPVARCPLSYIDIREVSGRHKLPPGRYVLIPATYQPGHEGDFLVRIYTEKPLISEEMDEETGLLQADGPPIHLSITEEDEEQLHEAFKQIAGVDLEIDAYELQALLNDTFIKVFKFDGFSSETCRSLVAMMDVDRSGKLGYDEFKKLWHDLHVWETAFRNQDKGESGAFDSFQLRKSFHDIGINVSNHTFRALAQRYSHKDGKIYFDDYILCIARLTTMFDIYGEMSKGTDKAQFNLDQFIQTTMYS